MRVHSRFCHVVVLGCLAAPISSALGQAAPRRDAADPGVVVTGQRVTPAGIQSVFDGRVGGVRFGNGSDDIWVAVPGGTYHLDWRSNRVLSRTPLAGRPGVFGVAIDPVTRRAFVSSVGRLPRSMDDSRLPGGERLPAGRAAARLHLLDAASTADSLLPLRSSAPLGDFMAGGPAVAAQPSLGGRRLAVLPMPANDMLAILDADSGSLVRTVPLGVEPIAAAIDARGTVAYVSILGGPKPTARQRSARQCCDARAEAVRVDARGIAERGSVSRVDLATGRVTHDLQVGRHPTAIVWHEATQRLYVADGNSETVSVIDTRGNTVVASITIAPFKERVVGLAPTGLAIAPDGRTLFVSLGGANAVAMYDVSGAPRDAKLLGLIPTAWYPASLDVSADGKHLAVGALFGIGSGTGRAGGSMGKEGRYVHAVRGAVNVVEIPDATQLLAYTTAVAQNDRLTLATSNANVPSATVRADAPARAVPERPGEPSRIKHVVFIVKENRTYDQVLGDLDRGARDSSLVNFGVDVTPNQHALAQQFVTLDHFFASGGNSADGHNWLTQANETEYPMWPLYYGRSYPSEGVDPLAYSSGGFLWESARAKGHEVKVFGEYAPSIENSSAPRRDSLFAEYRAKPTDYESHRTLLKARYTTKSDIASLDRELVREYPGWTMEVPDVVKAGDVLAHLADWERAGSMPALTMIILPSNHTSGTSPGWCTPKACVADNDYAFGMIVEGLTHSRFWRDMAILAVEDDAQDGVDHIDGHRTLAFAISPYTRRGIVDSTFYNQPSMVKTIELMLGLPALTMFDLVATDMRASFIGPDEQPDFTPYTAIEPRQSLYEKNLRVGAITGPHAAQRRAAARASMRMLFDGPDRAPSGALNRILWGDTRGWTTKYPGVRQSVFFPMMLDVEDDDRDEAPSAPTKKPASRR